MTSAMLRAAALPLLFFVAGIVPAHGATEIGGPGEKTRYEYAESLFRQGAYDTAVTELNNFVQDYPKGPYTDDAYYWLGMHNMRTGKETEGLDQFKIIIALMPDGDKAPAAQFELAYYWYNPAAAERDLERAMAEFLRIPFFYPESPLADDARYYAALCQYGQGRYPEAAAELKAFVDGNPGSEFAAPAGYYMGLAQLLDGRRDEALASFQAVRDAYPAGLYVDKALSAIELSKRSSDKTRPAEAYRQGGKGDAPGKLYKPTGAAFDPQGALYVADMGNSRVQRYRLSGGTLELDSSSISSPALDKKLMMDEPAAVAVGPKGRLCVADGGDNRVQVFGADGELLLTFGKRGPGPGELYGPSSIAVDDGGSIYVAERLNKRVSVFDSGGRFMRAVGTGGSAEKALRSPTAVALGIEGTLLVADDSTDALYGYDRKGALVMFYQKAPDGGYELKSPSGIAVDIVGNVYVTDRDRGSVIMFDNKLNPLMEFPASGKLDNPSGITVSDKGEVFVTVYGSDQVVVYK